MFARWRGLVWIVGPVAYLGLLVSPAVVLSVPFQVFHRHLIGYWLTVVVVLWVIYRLGRTSYRWYARRVIDLEAIVGFTGSLLALASCIWVYRSNLAAQS